MGAILLLDILKEFDLEEHYLRMFNLGIIDPNALAKISPSDFPRLGVEKTEDKNKILRLSQSMKERLQSGYYTQRQITTEHVPKKRPLSLVRTPEERPARRLTVTPQLPRSPPKHVAKERRLSTVLRTSNHDLQRTTTITATTTSSSNPNTQQKKTVYTSPTKPKTKPTDDMSEKRPRLTERPTTRLLDTYGVPYSQKRKQQHVSDFDTNDTSYLGTEPSVMSKPKPPLNLIPMNELQQRIRVCVRKRPLNKRETASNEADIASIVGSRTVELHAEKNRIDLSRFVETHSFTFDEAFDSHVTNQEIYARTAQPLIEYIFAGGNGTCFAFGQTGSGKTYTMLDSNDGLYVLAAQDIFRMLNQPNHSHLSASVGFYEIYQGQLYDLLNNRNKLAARDDGNNNVVIAGLKEYPIKNKEDLMGVFEYGNQGRTTGRTGVNNKSSRSHAVLQIILRAQHRSTETYGKLTFIDLAGSERGVDRGDANPKTRLEGAEINKSLLALKECIRALDQDKKHTPFRGSKLTQVLRDCFIGNARTCMIATISPNSSNAEHTLNTLRYADRVKQFKGESDPRLAPDFYSNINSHVKNENSTIEVAEEESTAITFEDAMEEDYDDELEESQSVTNSCVIDEEDKVENLFDVDFPVEVTTNALNTPTNNRFYSLREERQEQFMKRLESPPAELFLSRLTDPFDSKPLDFMQEDKNMHFPDTLEEHKDTMNNNNANSSSSRIDVERVRRFIKFHRAQIKDLENCLKEEKKVIAKLSLAINTTDMDEVDEDEYTKQEYENYLNDLNELLARSMSCMEIIQEKIKTELDG